MKLEKFRTLYLRAVVISLIIAFLSLVTTGIDDQGYKSAAQFLVLLFSVKITYEYFFKFL